MFTLALIVGRLTTNWRTTISSVCSTLRIMAAERFQDECAVRNTNQQSGVTMACSSPLYRSSGSYMIMCGDYILPLIPAVWRYRNQRVFWFHSRSRESISASLSSPIFSRPNEVNVNFKNNATWKRQNGHNDRKSQFPIWRLLASKHNLNVFLIFFQARRIWSTIPAM